MDPVISAADQQATELAIVDIMGSIQGDNIQRLASELDRLPLSQLDANTWDELLGMLLEHCSHYRANKAGRLLINRWECSAGFQMQYSMFARLFRMNISEEVLGWCADIYPEYSLPDLLLELARSEPDPTVEKATDLALKVYYPKEQVPLLLLQNGLTAAKLGNNTNMYNLLILRIEEVADPAPIPSHMIASQLTESELDEQLDERLAAHQQQVNEDLADVNSPEQVLAIILDNSLRVNEERLRVELSTLDKEQLRHRVEPFFRIGMAKKLLQNDVVLLRILGPANPLANANATEMELGGERMLTSEIMQEDWLDQEEDGYIQPWFTGVCQQCQLKIRHPWHAVRRPGETGGWFGCYCSWRCVSESVSEMAGDPAKTFVLIPDAVDKLVSFYKNQTDLVGILDRAADEPVIYQDPPLPVSDDQVNLSSANFRKGGTSAFSIQDYVKMTIKDEPPIAPGHYRELIQAGSGQEIDRQIEQGNSVLLVFTMEGCEPCRIVKKWLQEQAQLPPELKVLEAKVSTSPTLVNEYRVGVFPTLKLFHNGGVMPISFQPRDAQLEILEIMSSDKSIVLPSERTS